MDDFDCEPISISFVSFQDAKVLIFKCSRWGRRAFLRVWAPLVLWER